MKFEYRKSYGRWKLYPMDEDAKTLVHIFRTTQPNIKEGHRRQTTLLDDQYNVLAFFGMKFDIEVIPDKPPERSLKDTKVDSVKRADR